MITAVFSGVAAVLFSASVYWWARGRGGPRPAGNWAMCGLLLAFAVAFASYTPDIQEAVESVVPHLARLLSNAATLAAATAVLIFLFQLNLEPEEARRRARQRLLALLATVTGMSVLFFAEQAHHRSPQLYALYVLLYITYLGFTASGFLRQTWLQAAHSRRTSQKIGLRMTAVGCLLALVYASYKILVLLSLGLGLGLIHGEAPCSTPITPVRCALSVTTPALAVTLITIGLTLPAVLWPISQQLRRRWESRSYDALEPLWRELTGAAPNVVLGSEELEGEPNDVDLLLHRRVIEISDGILTLRPYQSLRIHEAAQRALDERQMKHGEERDAIVEAAVLHGAVQAKRAGKEPDSHEAPLAPGTASREGNLRAETQWLLRVAHAYAHSDIVRVAVTDTTPTSAGSQA